MFQFFANIFGYLLNFIYQFVNNYGLAMILFNVTNVHKTTKNYEKKC